MRTLATVMVKLPQDGRLVRTMRIYSEAVQYCVDVAWEEGIRTREGLHQRCYYGVRERFGLQAQLAVNAIKQALEMVKGSRTKPETGDRLTVRYNFPRCARVSDDWTVLSLSTIEGRIKFGIEVPEYYEEYLEWEIRESNLVMDRRGRLFFHFTLAREISAREFYAREEDRKVLGVDLGVNKLAVTSRAEFLGGDVKEKRILWEEFKAELQRKGTPGSRRRLKESGGRWKRFQRWVDHNLSRRIVDSLREGDVLVMEDLKGIRENAKHNPWVHKWTFRQFQKFIEYKALRKGIRVVYVSPKNTSKRCNRCGSMHTRRHGGFFECDSCGHSLDADLNAARNLARRYKRITGLAGTCKRAHDSRCDEAEAQKGIEAKHTRKSTPI